MRQRCREAPAPDQGGRAGGDALDLTLEIGPSKAAPLTLELRTGSVAFVVSLDGVKGTLEFLHSTAGLTFAPTSKVQEYVAGACPAPGVAP